MNMDWSALGLVLDGLGAILVLGTGIKRIQNIFRKYHPSYKEAQFAMMNLQLGTVTRGDEIFENVISLIEESHQDDVVKHEFYSQHLIIDSTKEFITAIPSPEVLPDDFPKHSKDELKANILEYLREEEGIEVSNLGNTPVEIFRSDRNVVQKIKSEDLTGPILAHYVPDIPKEYGIDGSELPIIKTEEYSRETIKSSYEDHIESIILRTGGGFLLLGFLMQLIARESVQSIPGNLIDLFSAIITRIMSHVPPLL